MLDDGRNRRKNKLFPELNANNNCVVIIQQRLKIIVDNIIVYTNKIL